jgi:hypothetical protein
VAAAKNTSIVAEDKRMIDNYDEAIALIEKMKGSLPITTYAGTVLVQTLRQGGTKITPKQGLQIHDVFLGDEGGIAYTIYLPGEQKTATVASLTHLRIPPDHPLAPEIQTYQLARGRKLTGIGSARPARFTVKPSKKSKKSKKRKKR